MGSGQEPVLARAGTRATSAIVDADRNFRNSREATRVANNAQIKQRRFGSIDRESNFLVEAVGAEAAR